MYLVRQCNVRTMACRYMSSVSKNHYDSLGINKSATQGEIKSAYYELSKIYHPDTNQGSEESLTKFRQITDAYEVLGNVKSRKLYDRGLIVGESGTVMRQDVEEDDAQTRFYKKREKRSEVPKKMDESTMYDFDAWSKAHYDVSRERTFATKVRQNKSAKIKVLKVEANKNFVATSVSLVVMALIFGFIMSFESYDRSNVTVKEKIKER